MSGPAAPTSASGRPLPSLIGMWKAFAELAELGWIGQRRPRIVAVQAAGCAPIVRAYNAGERHATRWEDGHTIAGGIRVPAVIGDFLVLDAVRESGGYAIAVSDDEIEAERRRVARARRPPLVPGRRRRRRRLRQVSPRGTHLDRRPMRRLQLRVGLQVPDAARRRPARPHSLDRPDDARLTPDR